VRDVTLGSRVFTILFPDLLRPLTPEENTALRAGITRDGVLCPVLVDEEDGVIDGGNRLTIAAEVGLKAVPVHVLRGLTHEQKRSHALSVNVERRHLTPDEQREARQRRVFRVAEARREGKSLRAIAEEERVSHPQVIADLKEATGKGLPVDPPNGKVQGRDGRERRIETRLDRLENAPVADDQPAWQIVTGDCLAELPKIPAGSVRLCFADPPYNIGIDYGAGVDADFLPEETYCRWFAEWIALCRDRLTADGSLWILISDEFAAEYVLALKRAGLYLRNWITWFESFGTNCTDKFNRTSRHLLYTTRHPRRVVFNQSAVSRPSDRQVKYNDARANPEGKILDDVWWDIPRLAGTHAERIPGFPTQLPLALLRRIIACASLPGDTVLDPFSGSGTTGHAALECNRRYVGIEESETFASVARKRLRAVIPHA
jgi:site-specific DNA-methyltransferase (adenine-specific)